MGLFSFLKKSEPIKPTDGDFFYPIGENVSLFGSNNISKQKMLMYFLEIPELFQVIAMKGNMFANMKLDVISKQTGQSLPLTNPIQKLLKFPNWYQGQKEFLKQTKIFREIYGNEYLHFLKPLGFGLGSTKQISTIDPVNLMLPDSVKNNTTPLFLQPDKPQFNYNYSYKSKTYPIPSNDILQINNPVINDNLTGVSLISELSAVLENIKGAYESRSTLIFNRGALGILSNAGKDGIGATAPMDAKDKKNLQDEYKKYGLTRKQWGLIITNLPLTFQKMAMNPKELMLFEEVEAGFQNVIGAYGLYRDMFPSVKGSTFENQKQAQKNAYINTIIPEAQEWVSALNTFFGLENKSYHITADYLHLSIFDEDLKNKGIALRNLVGALDQAFQSGALSLEEYTNQLNAAL